ncbi:MAG: rhomboid family intramembrane serine protease, partial [Armatimonadota bacterium]
MRNRLPYATLSIIILNVLVYLITSSYPLDAPYDYGLIPSELRDSYNFGRLVTSNFIHAGTLHLLLNMFMLYLMGRGVERAIGNTEFIIFYLCGAFVAASTHALMVIATADPSLETKPMVGASGAVAGIAGFYIIRYHKKRIKFLGTEVSAVLLVLLWAVSQLGFAITGLYRDKIFGMDINVVSYWSHIGGLLYGMTIAIISNMANNGQIDYLIEKAAYNVDNNNFLEAAGDLERIIKIEPDNAYAHYELGKIWALLLEKEQSLPYYQNAINLYVAQGKEKEALEVLANMKATWNDSEIAPLIKFKLATFLSETGEFEKAIDMFREIATNSPNTPEAEMSII